jgi:arylsulfatase A-like enzyme
MNIVVLMLDSLRADCVGCYGNSDIHTPNMDAFAAQSIRFTRAYPESPNTIPARTALVTGCYTFMNRPWMPLRADDLHIAELLREQGYLTAAFSDTPFNNGANMTRGFDEFVHFPMGKCLPPIEGETPTESDAYFPPDYSPPKEVNYYLRTMANREICTRKYGKYLPALMADQVNDWLTKHREDKFLLWIDSFGPHEPWDAPEPYRSMYEPRFGYEGRYLPMPMAPSMHWMGPGDIEHVRALYKASTTETDDQLVGPVIAHLDSLGLAEDTLVILMSDHGEELGDHGTIRKFGYPLYDELSRVVWMMRLPGTIPAGVCSPALISNIDFLPTIAQMAGFELPRTVDGVSLAPLVKGEAPSVHEKLYMGAWNVRSGVIWDRYKFIDNRGEKPNELFDMLCDPLERHNLVEEMPDLAHQLHRDLWDFHQPWSLKLSRHHKVG